MTKSTNWKASYDVVVLGFGGAGATAARFAADNGASVLLVDSAPYGHEGGNTRYSAQLIGTGYDKDKLKDYYLGLTSPLTLPESMVNTYVEGMLNIPTYAKKYLGVDKPVSYTKVFSKTHKEAQNVLAQEYPELKGNDTYDYTMVHNRWFDAALWKILRQKVLERKDKIDVWYDAPAKHLIQDPETKVIKGAQIEKNGQIVNVLAKNGVVLATGGFENNPQMIQNYLGTPKLSPLGTIYNKGAGIRMAEEIGANLWHMWNYETLGMLHGLSFATDTERSQLFFGWPELSDGSIFMVADDGKRYFNENEPNRHGHIFDHSEWRVPRTHQKPYLIFDQKQLDDIAKNHEMYEVIKDKLIKANSISELAEKIEISADGLEKQVEIFNQEADAGEDIQFNRDPKTLRKLSNDGPFYAIKLAYNILNTQGGPQRNANAQILDANEKPIPHLFGAGELGGICANQYQGGGNLAECLIFGKIAGENVANVTDKIDEQASTKYNGINELVDGNKIEDIDLANNQSLGTSDAGIGGKLVVRVTKDHGKISNVEVVQDHESEDIGKKALIEIPRKIVEANSTDVDAVSGASSTSRAIKEAVKDALSKTE